MRALVTGGAGFIGHHLARAIAGGGGSAVVLDNLRTGREENLAGIPNLTFVRASVTDRDAVFAACRGCTHVFHLAALVSVPESVERPLECVDINVRGFLNVLDAARDAGCAKVVLSSSAAIYGRCPRLPSAESDPPAPLSPYAVTKLDGEYYADLYTREFGLPTACLRYFNVFGEGQRPDSAYAAAIPAFASAAFAGRDLVIFGTGEATRDFVYVGDVARANLHAATGGAAGVHNVALGRPTSIRALAESILRLSGSRSRIVLAPERPGDVLHSTADVTRLAALGFRPETTVEDGLARTVGYFRKLWNI